MVDLLKFWGELLFIFLDGLTFCGGAVHVNHGYQEYGGKSTRYGAGHFYWIYKAEIIFCFFSF
jgi:hypothetical protein